MTFDLSKRYDIKATPTIFIQEKGKRCVLYHYNNAINFI